MPNGRLRVPGVLMLLLCINGLTARGHVAPSRDKNNRYLKLTPMGDRVRVAYTIFWGQLPGGQTRQQLDRNRNGTLEDSETEQYKERIAKSVASAVRFEVDDKPQTVEWSQVHLGLNTPETSGGAFSVDLVGWLCLPAPREQTSHKVRLYDGYRLPKPGENELRIDQGSGISIVQSMIADHRGSLLHFRWKGGSEKLEREGYTLRFKVDLKEADLEVDDLCTKRLAAIARAGAGNDGDKRSVPMYLLILAAVGVVGVAIAIALMKIRSRRLRG